MDADEQAFAVDLLRRWTNAITDREREKVEVQTRLFLVNRTIAQHMHADAEAEAERARLPRWRRWWHW